MRAPPGLDQIILRIGGQDSVVRLQDESATGMAALCDDPIQVQPGDELKIRTPTGWFAAKVIRVSATPEGTLVGLTRGQELHREKDRLGGSGISRWTIAAALGIGLLAFPLVTMLWPSSPPKQPVKARPTQAPRAATAKSALAPQTSSPHNKAVSNTK